MHIYYYNTLKKTKMQGESEEKDLDKSKVLIIIFHARNDLYN